MNFALTFSTTNDTYDQTSTDYYKHQQPYRPDTSALKLPNSICSSSLVTYHEECTTIAAFQSVEGSYIHQGW